MRRGSIITLIAGLALVSGALAGCAGPSNTAAPRSQPPVTTPGSSPSSSPSPSPSPAVTTTTAKPTQPPAPKASSSPQCTPAAGYQGAAAADPTSAVADAFQAAWGAPCVTRLAVAVYDRQTGTWYEQGDTAGTFASASVVKVFIAARLLLEGKANDQAIQDLMWKMITCSDDNAANTLYYTAGGEGTKDAQGNPVDGVATWAAKHYGIAVSTTPKPGWWGLTNVTPEAMASFYAKAMDEPVVWDWLGKAMANAQAKGCDGFDESYGLYSAAAQPRGVKQGWMDPDGTTRMHSTGYIDGGRYTVALFMQGTSKLYGAAGAADLTAVAKALLPGGHLPTNP